MKHLREYQESGLRVSLPDEGCFRIADCRTYQELSGKQLKEMDFGWWDKDNSKIILLELKGKEIWDGWTPGQSASARLIENLVAKATDMLLILSAVWLKTEIGSELSLELPGSVAGGLQAIKFVFLVDTPATQIPLLSNLKDKLNQILAGRMQLFGIRHATLVHLDNAIKMGLPIDRLP